MHPQQQGPQKKSPTKHTHLMRYTDFQFIKVLGMGSYGKVQLVQRKGIKYALKIIEKRLLAKQGKEYQVFIERELLKKMNHPGVITMKSCFQDQFCEGGTLQGFLCNNIQSRITEELRIFYIAQIVSVIQYFQKVGIVHRDLKPENILISQKGHLKVVDYGTAQVTQCKLVDQKFKQQLFQQKKASQQGQFLGITKFDSVSLSQVSQKYTQQQKNQEAQHQQDRQQKQNQQDQGNTKSQLLKKRKATFVGTCYYVPPELLENEQCYPSTDIWALGCIMYQLYYNMPPFDGTNQFQVFQKIKNIQYGFPKNQKISEQAIDLISQLLKKNPYQRLGSNSRQGLMLSDLKAHKYFKNISFQNLYQQQPPQLLEDQYSNPIEKQRQRLHRINNIVMSKYMPVIQEYDNENDKGNKNNDLILTHGVVEKRTFINFNYYYLIIFSNLRMLRVKVIQPGKIRENSVDLLGSLNTKDKLPAQQISQHVFKLVTEQKTYKLKSFQPLKWVNIINKRYSHLRQIYMKEKTEQSKQQNEKISSVQIQKVIKEITQKLRNIKIQLDQN